MTIFRRTKNRLSFWTDTSGIVFAEAVVSLALTGIFMTAVVFMITVSLRLFDRMQSVSRAVMVSSVVLDQVADELEDKSVQEVIDQMEEKSRRTDSNVYLGFEIEALSCTCPSPEEHPDVFRIDLTLYLDRTGMKYDTYRYVKLFHNTDDNEILDEDILEVWK